MNRLTSIGSALRKQGKYKDALPYLQRALAISEKTLGPDHPGVAAALSDLGTNLRRLARYEEALQAHRRELAIQEKVFGPESLSVARALDDVSATLAEQGRPSSGGINSPDTYSQAAEALSYLQHSLAIKEKALGPEHLDLGSTLAKLANMSIDVGDLNAALAYNRRALAIEEKVLGPEHPVVAVVLSNLGGHPVPTR